MDITPQDDTGSQSITDDQELAKALAGITADEPVAPVVPPIAVPQYEEIPAAAPVLPPIEMTPEPVAPVAPAEPVAPVSVAPSSDLDGIKRTALDELRPLIDRVDLPAEEKFDTYLMLIRSTDDTALIAPAHAAAQGIADEKRKAQALLDIIKEIDFLSHPQA